MLVYKFRIGDVEDPELSADLIITQWLSTEQGKWVIAHAINGPVYHFTPDLEHIGTLVTVTANLSKGDETYFLLKWR